MNIRTKTLFIVLSAVIILLIAIYLVSATIIMRSFNNLENQKIKKNTEVLLDVIKTRLENMDILTRDWAYWDDAYTFVQNKNPYFAKKAISPSICKDSNTNFIVFTNKKGHILLSRGFDLEKNENMPIPQSIQELVTQPKMLDLPDKNSRTLGLLVIPEGLLMVSARGILKTDYTGPSQGTLLFARYLDAREIKTLSDMAHLDFSLFEIDNKHWDPRISALINKFHSKAPFVIEPVNKDLLNCYVQLQDIYQQPAAIFKISMVRDIYQQGRQSFYLLIIAIIIIGIIYFVIVSYIVDHDFLMKFMRFVREIKTIEKTANLTHRLPVIGNDEFASLSKSANSMLNALEQAENAKSNFLAIISHEIRTPINGIVGMLELLKTEKLTPKQNKLVNAASSSVKILLTLVNDILDYSKLQAGKISLSPVSFNLYSLLCDVQTIAEPLAEQKGLTFSLKFPPEYTMQYFYADEFRLRQVLMNIVNNALKFTVTGEICLEAILQAQDPEHVKLQLAIKDTGIGIPPDKLDKVFEVFEQADSSIARKHGGSGLGLAICKQLIEIMQGQLKVQAHQPQGSEFWIELTLPKVTATPSVESTTSVLPLEKAQQNSRILVAEDNEVNILYITSLLEAAGYQLDTVLSGKAAIEAVRHNSYTLILMDIHMPDMDGITAAKAIRAEGISIPIITVSADLSSRILEKTKDAGINDFLGKPYTRKELQAMLQKYGLSLNQAQTTSEAISIHQALYQAMSAQHIPEENTISIIAQTKLSLKNYADLIQQELNKTPVNWEIIIAKTHSLKGTLSVFSAFEHELLKPYTINIIGLYSAAKKMDLVKFKEQYASFYDQKLQEFII